MGFQSFLLGVLVGPEGPAVLVGRVDNSANLQVGREVRGESMGAIPEVQVAGHLVDLEVGHPMDPEVGRLVDPEVGCLVGPEGPAVLVGRVDNSASLQVGREVQGESMGAILEVQVVGHLVDPEVGHPVDPEVGRLVDPEVGRLEDQVVDSAHSGRQEVDPEGVDRPDRHGNLGRNRTLE